MAVRKGRENSRPENGRRKRRWVRLRSIGLLVCCFGWTGAVDLSLPLDFDGSFSEVPIAPGNAIFESRGCVSGR